MYVCTYVRTYVRMYVMSVCLSVWLSIYLSMHPLTYSFINLFKIPANWNHSVYVSSYTEVIN